MENNRQNYVYHGSKEIFEFVIPKRQIRTRSYDDGRVETIFDQVSFHATTHKWIALAYMYDRGAYNLGGKITQYNMGIDLYRYEENIEIYGYESLEKSLHAMYGAGGYLFVFEAKNFFHTEGLGNLEVITQKELKPVHVENVLDPVLEMKSLGVTFTFIDLALPENAPFRNYCS